MGGWLVPPSDKEDGIALEGDKDICAEASMLAATIIKEAKTNFIIKCIESCSHKNCKADCGSVAILTPMHSIHQRHAVAVAEEAVAFADGFVVGAEGVVVAGESADEHEQG